MFSSEAESRAFFGSANFVVLVFLAWGGCFALYILARKNRGVRGVVIAAAVIALFWIGFATVRVLNFLLLLERAS